MAKTILNDDGQEVTVFTQDEIDAQILAKEAAIKADYDAKLSEADRLSKEARERLDQFQQASKGVDKEREEVRLMAEEAKRIAEEAKGSVTLAKEAELATKKDFYIQSISGGDPEIKQRLEEAYSIINLPTTNDSEIRDRVQKAVSMAGITHVSTPSLSFGGGTAPKTQPINEAARQAAHEQWKKDLSINI